LWSISIVEKQKIIGPNDKILVTGANGFIGKVLVETLLEQGFTNIACFVRPSANLEALNKVIDRFKYATVIIQKGNLLSIDDCRKATKDVSVIYHLAAGVEKSFPGNFQNSVITTRNLLDCIKEDKSFKRFLNVSSFAVYTGMSVKQGALLDEESKIEQKSHQRGEAYTYGKIKQDELVKEYHNEYGIPYAIVRPGVVYGPGKANIFGRVGIDTFGFFLHLGGQNSFPVTYVKNCADAIILAGITEGANGQTYNIVDDELPTCREYLKAYKKNVKNFFSIYLPYPMFFLMCYLWEKYSKWSKGQLPPVFNRMRCAAHWKARTYTNQKLKTELGWQPKIDYGKAIRIYFDYLKNGAH